MFIIVINSVRSIDEDVRWLQFVQRFQSQLNINSSINSLPMCTTWISNNYQSTSALDRTLENIEKWGKHCVSRYDCISGHISFQNHGLSVTEQLSAGVRRLVLELHFVPGLKRNLRLCASLQGKSCTPLRLCAPLQLCKVSHAHHSDWINIIRIDFSAFCVFYKHFIKLFSTTQKRFRHLRFWQLPPSPPQLWVPQIGLFMCLICSKKFHLVFYCFINNQRHFYSHFWRLNTFKICDTDCSLYQYIS